MLHLILYDHVFSKQNMWINTKNKSGHFCNWISPIKFSKCDDNLTLNGGIKNGCSRLVAIFLNLSLNFTIVF